MWARIVTVLLLGYLCMGRSFAYWGIPPLHLFIGEVLLVLFLICGPRTAHGHWVWLAMKDPALRRYKKMLVILLIFGIFQSLRGIFLGYSPLLAMRDLALNYYPIYFFMGLWASSQDQEYLPKFFRLAGWANGVYGTLFIFALSRIPWSFPGFSENAQPVQVFGQPSFSALILLGLLSFEEDLRRVWPLLALNAFVLLGMLIRAEWVAFALGLLVWGWATKNLRRVALGGAIVLALLSLMYLTNFTYQGPATRGGTISAVDMLGRVLAPVNADLAANYTSDVQQYEGNVVWRTIFWLEIWNTVHESTGRSLFGYGYGYPLNDLVPYLEGDATRTPHNVFFYVLAYTGWTGVLIFGALQAELFSLLWRVRSLGGRPFGVVFGVAVLAFALFTPFFEVPQGAIPFYLLAGSVCAGLLRTRTRVSANWLPVPQPAI